MERAMRRGSGVVGTILLFFAIGCGVAGSEQAAGQERPPMDVKPPSDDYLVAEQTEAPYPGTGVTVEGHITRGSTSAGNNTIPTWRVEWTVTNHTARTVALGQSLTILEKVADTDEPIGIFVARETKPASTRLKLMSVRYGLAWGLTVGTDGPGIWPFGALPGGSSLSGADMLLMALGSSWIKPYYPDGGYPSAAPGRTVLVKEEVLIPLKSGPQWVVVMPPVVLERGKAPIQVVWRFEVGGATVPGQALSPANVATYPLEATALARLATDAAQPPWLRLHALNWLSETNFDAARDPLMRLAADEGAARTIRNSAILNLGLHQHGAAVPLILGRLRSPDAGDRAVAVAALGEANDPSVTPQLRALLDDPAEMVAVEAIEALGKLKDPVSVAPMLSRMVDKQREKQADTIARALAHVDTPEAWSGLIATASDRNAPFQARRSSILALGSAHHAAAVPPLASIVANEGDEDGIRSNAIDALEMLGGADAWTAIRAAVAAKKPMVAQSAIRALASSKDAATRAYVVEIAGSPRHPLRDDAIDQIAAHKIPNADATLRAALRDGSTPTKTMIRAAAALHATAQEPESADTAALWNAYQREKDGYLGSRLADALIEQKFNDKGAIPVLVAGLEEGKNKLWFSNVKLLRHLTGQSFGPENEYAGDKRARASDLGKWRAWWVAQPK
jgi:HEAT repeat protein